MVKNTCKNKLTAFTITLKRYNHASPTKISSARDFINETWNTSVGVVPVIVDCWEGPVDEEAEDGAKKTVADDDRRPRVRVLEASHPSPQVVQLATADKQHQKFSS